MSLHFCPRISTAAIAMAAVIASTSFVAAQNTPGVTATEIKIGNFAPYSGPVSALSVPAKAEAAYFKMINDQGGINGRKINFISYDDAYSPPKTVEQTRKLVESDEVLLIFSPLGTATNIAVQKYLNTKKVPHIFIASAAARWGDPKHFPWSMGWSPTYRAEGEVYARYILENQPNGKIGILYQNDDMGKDYLAGIHKGLGDKAKQMIVMEAPYDTSTPTVDSEIVRIKAANPDIFINVTTPKFAAQAIRKIGELGWHPTQFLVNVSAIVGSVLKPAGLDNSKGIISAGYLKDPTDPEWNDYPDMKAWRTFVDKYYPDADRSDLLVVYGYAAGQALVQVLKQCGNDLSRENVMKQAANLDMVVGGMMPGIRVKTSPTDFYPTEQFQLKQFDGTTWKLLGKVLEASHD
jgi:branched-chain amino acid transport system substrate-binding protein